MFFKAPLPAENTAFFGGEEQECSKVVQTMEDLKISYSALSAPKTA